VEFNSRTPGTLALAGRVDHDPCVLPNVKQLFTYGLPGFVGALQFESVEPNPAAPILAHIHPQGSDLDLRQFIKTRRTFHVTSMLAYQFLLFNFETTGLLAHRFPPRKAHDHIL
jgi:hypothetical protein